MVMKKTILLFLILVSGVLTPMLTFGQVSTINFNNQHQKIDGFGGSSAWQGQLNTAELNTLFKNGAGQLGFNILRLRIDPTMAWAQEAANAKNAKALGATVFATPWTPPASMKTNNNTVGGQLLTSSYAAYASYLNQFINYVGTNNIDIISLQNEPDFNPTYESCSWDAAQFHTFCLNNAGSIIKPVMMPESFHYDFTLSDPTLNDPAAAKNISYVGGHLYGVEPQTYTNAINLGKPVWMTEWNATDYSSTGLMVLGKQILDCMYQNFNAYVYWWVAEAGNGVISSAGVPNGYGYIMAQFSKFVRPGYYRVDATYNPQSGVYVVAFKGDGNYVVVTVNNSTSSKTQQFALENGTVANMTKYTTSISKNISDDGTVAVTGGTFTSTLDAQSVTTFVGTSTTTTCTAPAAPTVTTPITYCQGATASALKATASTGGTLNWYTTATGGTASATAPTPSATTSGSTTYYVSQTIGCESPRASIVVSVNATPSAPAVTSPVTYCQGTTAVPLTATGASLQWYTSATGGTASATAPTPSTTTIGTTGYYVSQTNSSGCESPRAAIAVTIDAPPTASNAGTTQNITTTSTTLSANAPTIGIGKWTVVSGTATFANPSSANTSVSSLSLGANVLEWTTSNGTCPSSSSAVTINVGNSVTQGPIISITSPANNASYTSPASITVSANATDATGAITAVKFLNDATTVGIDSTAPYSITWTNVTAGTYSITAIATDNNGASATSSAVTVKVNAPTPPTVSITSPANNASFTAPASITIAASATDVSGTITSVQFYNGTTLLGSATTAPYSFTWANVAAGAYAVTAKVTDSNGNTATSAAIDITVSAVSTADITGPTCGAINSTISFALNPSHRANATSYSWYFQGYTKSITPTAGAAYDVTISTGQYFTGGEVCVGIQYSGAPYYASYCLKVSECSAARLSGAAITSGALSIAPNPFTSDFNLSAPEPLAHISITNSIGEQVFSQDYGNATGAIDLGNNLVSGLYLVTITYSSGRVETTRVAKNQ